MTPNTPITLTAEQVAELRELLEIWDEDTNSLLPLRGTAILDSAASVTQEPVGWVDPYDNFEEHLGQWMIDEPGVTWSPVYRHPPAAPAPTDNEALQSHDESRRIGRLITNHIRMRAILDKANQDHGAFAMWLGDMLVASRSTQTKKEGE